MGEVEIGRTRERDGVQGMLEGSFTCVCACDVCVYGVNGNVWGGGDGVGQREPLWANSKRRSPVRHTRTLHTNVSRSASVCVCAVVTRLHLTACLCPFAYFCVCVFWAFLFQTLFALILEIINAVTDGMKAKKRREEET